MKTTPLLLAAAALLVAGTLGCKTPKHHGEHPSSEASEHPSSQPSEHPDGESSGDEHREHPEGTSHKSEHPE